MTNRDPGAVGPIVVLANPTAGRGGGGVLVPAVIARLGAAGHSVRLLDATDRDQALAGCRTAVRDRPAALVVIGGDGTVHLALQAVAGSGTPLGVVPAGTGNDFAIGTRVPADPLDAAEAIAAGLAAGRTRRFDLARVTAADGRTLWYGGVLGAGFDAVVNERANRMRYPRGTRRYDVAILAELLGLRPRRYTITLEGVERQVDAVVVAVGNLPSYGGGLRICPTADPTDGMLDVVVGAAMSRATLLRLKPRVRAGTHVSHPLVSAYRARTVTLAADGVTAYADGERAVPLPVSIAAVPGALVML